MEQFTQAKVDMVDKDRRQPRVPLFGVADVKVMSSGKSFLYTALTQNITMVGMGMYMHDALEVGTPVLITIKFTKKNGQRPADVVEGVVTSLSEMESFYCVGVRFNSPLNAKDQPNLLSVFERV